MSAKGLVKILSLPFLTLAIGTCAIRVAGHFFPNQQDSCKKMLLRWGADIDLSPTSFFKNVT